MEEYMSLKIHYGGDFMDSELTIYEGGPIDDLKIDVVKWSYFELVGMLKELRYGEINTIYYKNPNFGMNVLADDSGVLDIVDLCRVNLSVDVYIQHPLSQS